MNFAALLSSQFFAPLFWTQFFGAFNDNLYKNALVILMTLNASSYTSLSIDVLIPLSGGIFILPFFLFSALAGQLADKFEKSKLIRMVKIGEINIMILAGLGFYLENIWFLLSVLFFMGCQSSLFGPVKYSILPQHLSEEGLLKANAMIEMGTFLAILMGTILGGLLIANEENGRLYVSVLVLSIAFLGWLSSLKIPIAESANKTLKVKYNIFSETWKILSIATNNRLIFGAILAISWFWFVGATMLSLIPLPAFTHDILWGHDRVITLLLTLFSIGVGVGSIIAGHSKTLTKSIKWVVIGAIGISVVALDLYWVSTQLAESYLSTKPSVLQSWQAMFSHPMRANILLDILLFGAFGGLYIVPLYVILQEHSNIKSRSRTIAANNIVNSLFMVISALVTMLLLSNGVSIEQIFALIGVLNALIFSFLSIRFSKDVRRILAIDE